MTDFLMAESGIRKLYARYVDAGWRKDTGSFAECFTEDGVWKVLGSHLCGHKEISNYFDQLMANFERVVMMIGMPFLEVGAGTAIGRVHASEIAKGVDGQTVRSIGVYYDRFVEQNGLWKFQWHHFDLCYLGPADFSGPFLDCPDYGPPPAMPRPEDPAFMG